MNHLLLAIELKTKFLKTLKELKKEGESDVDEAKIDFSLKALSFIEFLASGTYLFLLTFLGLQPHARLLPLSFCTACSSISAALETGNKGTCIYAYLNIEYDAEKGSFRGETGRTPYFDEEFFGDNMKEAFFELGYALEVSPEVWWLGVDA